MILVTKTSEYVCMYVCMFIIDPFNDWGGRGCNKFVQGNGTKIAPTGDIFDQPPGQMR